MVLFSTYNFFIFGPTDSWHIWPFWWLIE